jgi:hypothetical protein
VLTAFGGAGETPRKGGTLRVGMIAEPATLDMHWQLELTAQLIAGHYLERLYTQGQDYGVANTPPTPDQPRPVGCPYRMVGDSPGSDTQQSLAL